MILRCILLCILVGICGVVAERSLSAKDEEDVIALWMPHVNTTTEDEYYCMGVNTAFDVRYIKKYVPHASAEQVHHILIYGCSNPVKTQGANNAWKCLNDHPVQAACGGASKFLYAWAKDAPSLQLPDDVGFKIGQKTDVKGIFIQIHYSAVVTNDNSGISMILTSEPRRYAAGILLMAGGGQWIPARTPVVNVNVMCRYTDNLVIHPFGFRTHAHSLGTVISGWYMKPEDQDEGKWTLLGKQSPQNPQAFYHMDKPHNITAGTILGARCVYNSTTRNTPTIMGPTHNDEMCNFYMMYYADRNTVREGCTDVDMDLMDYQLPREASIPLPESEVMGHHHHGATGMDGSTTSTMPPMPMPEANVTPKQTLPEDVAANEIKLPRRRPGMENLGENFERGKGREGEPLDNSITIAKRPDPTISGNYEHNLGHQGEHHEHGHQMDQPAGSNVVVGQPKSPSSKYIYEEVAKWSAKLGKLGQVSGIALDHTDDNVYIFNRRNHQWDGTSFGFDNVYTKVQEGPIQQAAIIVVDAKTGAIKKEFGQNMFYMPHGITVDKAGDVWVTDVALHQVMKLTDGKPTLTLGTQFQPGHDGQHFCKPTMVAVHSNGDFYVADGYCNSRVIKFTPDGRYISHFGQQQYNPLAFMGSIQPAPADFLIPHDIKLSDDESVLFIADRENGRVQAFNTQNLQFLRLYQVPEFGFKVFAIDTAGDLMVAVNGAADLPGEVSTVQAILVNVTTGTTIGVVNSPSTPMASPHAVSISRDQNCIFVVELNGNIQQFHLKGSEKPVVSKLTNQKQSAAKSNNISSTSLNLLASNPLSPDGSGYSFLMLAIFIVPTLLLCVGLGYCCVRRNRQSSASRWKDTLYRFKPALKDGKNLVGGPRRSSREGFRPLRQEEVFDDETDSDDEVFSAQKPRRNNMA